MADGPPRIFDYGVRAQRRARARLMPGERFLIEEAADGLRHRLAAVNRSFNSALALDENAAGGMQGCAATWYEAKFELDDRLIAQGNVDVAVSILSLHAVNDLPGVFAQVRRALKPDGLLLAALFGGATLTELRQSLAAGEIEVSAGASPRVAPFADVRELGTLLQRAGFALPVADVERTTVRYRDFATLVHDLRLMGETNSLAERRPLSRAVLNAALEYYVDHFSDPDGRLRATFDIVYLTGWAPHESQQKPLKPGSAKARLADALGTKEHSADDKAKPG